MASENPILNNPYTEPKQYYDTDSTGSLDYNKVVKGRRIFKGTISTLPQKQGPQKELYEWNDDGDNYKDLLVNLVREEVGKWRKEGYPNTTRVTKTLLDYWFRNEERLNEHKLFFAQQEAVESAIWLNEVAEKSNVGNNILGKLKEAQLVTDAADNNLPRIAFKMATGSGKTVVMACLILYHYLNRQEYRGDTRFADNFLLVAPGVTIKDRLSVLFVDESKAENMAHDYYRVRRLVPAVFQGQLVGLNARIVITNYHAFEPKTLQGNKKSPFDGKITSTGEKLEAKESFNQLAKRLLGKFKTDSRLLVLNDEAHHCYLPRQKDKQSKKYKTEAEPDAEVKQENERAAVWYNGLLEISRRYKIKTVYDLSATPYYLQGSGYPSYSLFPWVVSDFGLIEAIESGLVKIPFLPEKDNTHNTHNAMLADLYEHVKIELPRKGQRTAKSEAKKEGKKLKEEPPNLPILVKTALDQFYSRYEKDFHRVGDLFNSPPVFIAVCNNTSVSKEVYKFIAGYEYENEKGETIIHPGTLELFSNYEQAGGVWRLKKKPPTLLIDSDALENNGQITDDFKKIFASEIENFRRDYARIHGAGSADKITEAEILREVVNTVGKPNSLGSHIRCVVSVSMLTEGWDANTVTHIMGLRAFGSQLLCEQVAGRALRRKNYILGKDGKFPPEYAQIIGVPFKLFKQGQESETPPPPDYEEVYAMPERQKKYEITFPNIIGYREEISDDNIVADFSRVENFELDGSKLPTQTVMFTAFSEEKEKLEVVQVRKMRRQTIVYALTKELIFLYFNDEQTGRKFDKFHQLKRVVEEWYDTKIHCIGDTYPQMVVYANPKTVCQYIYSGIRKGSKGDRRVLPIFNHYNRFGSTKYVNAKTTKPVYPTEKSHLNYVVADTASTKDDANLWEHIAAKTLEEIKEVKSYVKNSYLGFTIPYTDGGKDKLYYPDFIARCETKSGQMLNLIIEITGANKKDKALKKDFVNDLWLPAVNQVRELYGMDEWGFIEIANDIREIKNQLKAKLSAT